MYTLTDLKVGSEILSQYKQTPNVKFRGIEGQDPEHRAEAI